MEGRLIVRHREESSAIRTNQTVYRPQNATSGGWLEVHPSFAAGFAALGLDSPSGFLDLPGEVVSGHPDRHVVRVHLPGFPAAFYLKRQHMVMRREKWRNWRVGFGWVSRCEREAAILKQLTAAGLPCPRWAAVGVDRRGRAFLLVEELAGAVDLRQVLNDTGLSVADRLSFAEQLGRLIAMFHTSGFTTPELTAKHVLVSPKEGEIVLIDWQSARRVPAVPLRDRLRSLAALHASVADPLATPRERLRVFWAALRSSRQAGLIPGRFSDLVRQVVAEAARIAEHRSIRDQRRSTAVVQRLVWVAGEAVCAVPDVAAVWPNPAIAAPYYGGEPGMFPIQLPDGREAVLIRGRSFTPVGRFIAWVRGRSWRSPGVTLGRLLFHLERYGIPAPRLYAFGQRFTGSTTAEWFTLHTPVAAPITTPPDLATAEQLGRRLRQLHDAGCSVVGNPLAIFGLDDGSVCIRDILAIRIAKPKADHELRCLLAALSPWVRKAVKEGYQPGQHPASRAHLDLGMRTASRQTSVDVIP
jgi:tRNA A-37 threonylcarbamoyl transferase component Bud32